MVIVIKGDGAVRGPVSGDLEVEPTRHVLHEPLAQRHRLRDTSAPLKVVRTVLPLVLGIALVLYLLTR